MTSHRAPVWARIETLWLLVPALVAAIYALLQPLAPNDLWYHVRAGQIIAQTGAVPTQNLMSHGVPLQTPYFYQSWLSELLLFQTLQIGGLSGLQILRTACLTLAFALVTLAAFRLLRRQNVPALVAARWAALGAIWGFLLSSNNVDLRPQTFSVALCGAFVFSLLEFDAGGKRKLWGAVLLGLSVLWANFHGAFVVALVLVLGFAVARTVFAPSEARRDSRAFWLLLVGCILATLLNPHGPALYTYLARLSSDPISQKYIQEWSAPSLSDWHSWLFFAGLPLLLWGLWRRDWLRKPAGAPALAALFLWIMGIRDARAMIWFALAFTPLLAFFLAPRKSEITEASIEITPPIPLFARVLNGVLLAILLALPLPLLPGVKANLPWPAEFRARFAPTPARLFPSDASLLLERTTPVEIVEWLQKSATSGAAPRRDVFTDMVSGSYLTYAGQGFVIPLCDPRIELFGAPFWEEYVRLSGGPDDASRALLTRGFRWALLDLETQKPLLKTLQGAGWETISAVGKTRLLRAPST